MKVKFRSGLTSFEKMALNKSCLTDPLLRSRISEWSEPMWQELPLSATLQITRF